MRTDSQIFLRLLWMLPKRKLLNSMALNILILVNTKTKSASAQEAHEAIRPTYFEKSTVDGENNEKRLYELIWKRAISSQMSDAQLEKTIVTIGSSKSKDILTATGEVIKFDGFLKVYMESTDDETEETQDGLYPLLK